jgi:hypothetical protein
MCIIFIYNIYVLQVKGRKWQWIGYPARKEPLKITRQPLTTRLVQVDKSMQTISMCDNCTHVCDKRKTKTNPEKKLETGIVKHSSNLE